MAVPCYIFRTSTTTKIVFTAHAVGICHLFAVRQETDCAIGLLVGLLGDRGSKSLLKSDIVHHVLYEKAQIWLPIWVSYVQ